METPPLVGGEETSNPTWLVLQELKYKKSTSLHNPFCVSLLPDFKSCKEIFPFNVPPTYTNPNLLCFTTEPLLNPKDIVPPYVFLIPPLGAHTDATADGAIAAESYET